MPRNAITYTLIPKFLEGVVAKGYEVDQVLKECELNPALLSTPGLNLDFWAFSRLCRRIVELLKDETYGLLGVPQSMGTNELIALVLLHCDTLESAIFRLADLSNKSGNGLQHSVRTTRTNCEYRIDIAPDCLILNETAIDVTLLSRYRLLCWLSDKRIPVTQIVHPYPPPKWRDEYHYMYGRAKMFFDKKYASVTFDKVYLKNPVLQDESNLNEHVSVPFDILPPIDKHLGPLSLKMKRLIYEHLKQTHCVPTLSAMASKIGIYDHTLRRKLDREGITFRELAAIARQDIALTLLRDKSLSIEEIAIMVGYSEASAFIRAFKSWTHMTPQYFRKER
jgi:AraC-like DNA-binding protein